MPYSRILLITIATLALGACANLLAKMYGIQELEDFDQEAYSAFARGGLANLSWNTANRFATFVPHTAVATDSLAVTLSDYKHIYPDIGWRQKEYTVLIFWTLMLRKISKSAMEVVANNIKQADREKETTVILINTDKYFAAMP